MAMTMADVLRRLGLEEPCLFSAYWSGDDATTTELSAELVAGGLAEPEDEVEAKLLDMPRELGCELRKRSRSYTVLTEMVLEVARALKARRVEEHRKGEARGPCLPAAAASKHHPPLGSFAPDRWPTRLRGSLAGADGPQARQEAEPGRSPRTLTE